MSARRFRKRPIEVDAIQWIGPGPDPEVEEFAGEAFVSWMPSVQRLKLRTLEGSFLATPGDWIIRGVQNEIYPCKPSIFNATYEMAGEGHPHGGT